MIFPTLVNNEVNLSDLVPIKWADGEHPLDLTQYGGVIIGVEFYEQSFDEFSGVDHTQFHLQLLVLLLAVQPSTH